MKAIGRRVDQLLDSLELSLFTQGELLAAAPDAFEADRPFTPEMLARMRPLAQLELTEVAEGSL